MMPGNVGPQEIYAPRPVLDLGTRAIGALEVKLYGLLAEGQQITDAMLATTQQFLETEVAARVEAMGDSNGLGFVIVHPGDLGLTIAAQWWAQGSVLCQHIYRKAYAEADPMDTVTRPAVGCVWELALISAEQDAWRATMMQGTPDPAAYLARRASLDAA